jgi:hypothetical protein
VIQANATVKCQCEWPEIERTGGVRALCLPLSKLTVALTTLTGNRDTMQAVRDIAVMFESLCRFSRVSGRPESHAL